MQRLSYEPIRISSSLASMYFLKKKTVYILSFCKSTFILSLDFLQKYHRFRTNISTNLRSLLLFIIIDFLIYKQLINHIINQSSDFE